MRSWIERQKWFANDNFEVKYYNRPPAWFPKLSVLRTFAQPRYALLLDSEGRVREIYKSPRELPPHPLLQLSPLLLAKSSGQNFMTLLDGIPYLVTSKSIMGAEGRQVPLMLASPIDDEFLAASIDSSGHMVALLTPEENPKIMVSSNMAEMPPGTPLSELQEKYLITGQEFFDYGNSDLGIKLTSFISKADVEALIRSLISKERKERSIAALIFISSFISVMFWITRRVQRLTREITEFSRDALGVQKQKVQKNVEPRYLELEITESAMMSDPGEAMDILSRLHKTGIRLSIDDFGTGFSSLAYLKRLSVDEIKIDRSFVMHMYENESDAAIVRSTIELGHNLGLKVMAEGVERREIWNILKTLGCDRAQGFHISRPLPPAEFMKWLNKSNWKVAEE